MIRVRIQVVDKDEETDHETEAVAEFTDQDGESMERLGQLIGYSLNSLYVCLKGDGTDFKTGLEETLHESVR